MTEVFDFAADRGTCPFDPPARYARLLVEDPLSRISLWDGSRIWMVTRHADVRAVLGDTRFSANNLRPGFPLLTPTSEALTQSNPTFVRMDPPEHDRLRRMLDGEFTIKRAAAMRPQIQELVDGFADRMLEHAPPADLVAEFALPIPSLVICLILGVPYEDHDYFQKCTATMIDQQATEAQVEAASQELSGFLTALVERKAAQPSDDLLSRLVVEREQRGELSRDDVISMARVLLVAGHETTAMMIAYGMLALLHNPDQLALLRAEPALLPGAVDELLRYLTVIHTGVPRVAVEDVQVGGELIRAGEGVLCYLPTADRDVERFDDPDVLDVRRRNRGHVAFGYGIHQCIGQSLARVEIQVALGTLLRRFPEMQLARPFEDLPFRHEMFVDGVHELPVTW